MNQLKFHQETLFFFLLLILLAAIGFSEFRQSEPSRGPMQLTSKNISGRL